MEQQGKNAIKDLHAALNKAVMEAYGFASLDVNSILADLLALNEIVHNKEVKGEQITAPGLPNYISNRESYVSEECVTFEWE